MTRGKKDKRTRPGQDLRGVPKGGAKENFDDVTAVPDVPIAQYVRDAMEKADAAEGAAKSPGPRRSGALPAPPQKLPSVPDLELESPLESIRPAPPRESALSIELEDEQTGARVAPKAPPSPAVPKTLSAEFSLDLDVRPEPDHSDPRLQELHAKFEGGDYTGALALAEQLQASHPDLPSVGSYVATCKDLLVQGYTAELGSLEQVVVLAVPPDHLRWLSLDHRAGFLLSLVDGVSTLAELLDVSGMPQVDALRIACMLFEQRVIAFDKD